MEVIDLKKSDCAETVLITVTPAEREKLRKYCEFFEISLSHLLGEELPQPKNAQQIVKVFTSVTIKPETGIQNSIAGISFVNATKAQWLKMTLINKSVITARPEGLKMAIGSLLSIFAEEGLTHEQASKMAIKSPRLLSTSKSFLQTNIAAITERFEAVGVTKRKILETSLIVPTVLSLKADNLIPKLEAIQRAEAAGFIRYPTMQNGDYGDLGDFIKKYPMTIGVSLAMLSHGIDLCQQHHAVAGQPYKDIPVGATKQSITRVRLQNLKNPILRQKRQPIVSRKQKPVWLLREDEQGNAALIYGGRSERLGVRTVSLIKALQHSVVSPASRSEHQGLVSISNNLLIMIADNLRNIAEALNPKRNLITGNYTDGGLRLADPTALVIERRRSPKAAL